MLKFSLLLFFVLSFSEVALAQVEENSVAPQITEQKLVRIPDASDDKETKKLLTEMAKRAGWFPEIKINVINGIVIIEGKAKEQKRLTWLAKTADKLPTVIAVINKAEILTPPFTDMSPFFKELKLMLNRIKKHLPRIGMGLLMGSLFIFIGLKLQGFSRSIWSRKIPNIFLAKTVARLIMLPLWLMFFYLSLLTVGLEGLAGTIIGGTGVLGIVLGFAFKGIAENYLSGLLLAIRSPFTKGDSVKINDIEGIIQNLNMRGTTLLDSDGNLILVPNITVIQSVVKNMSANQNKRATFLIGVGLADSIKKCQELILEALRTVNGVSFDPPPMIFVENLGTSTVNIRVYFWFNTKTSTEAILKSSAIVKTKDLLLANGIHLPDSARELVLVDPLKVQMMQEPETDTQLEDKQQRLQSVAEENFKEAQDLESSDGEHDRELQKIANEVTLPTQKGKDNFLLTH